MTLEEFEMLTEEQKRQALAYQETYQEYKDLEAHSMIFKCKPTYNFQSIEFEWEAGTELELEAMFNLYDNIVKKLQEIAPEQPTNNVKKETVKKESKKKVVPATEKQIALMNKFGIKYPEDCSLELAQKLIKENMQKSNK